MVTWWHGDMVTWWHGEVMKWWSDEVIGITSLPSNAAFKVNNSWSWTSDTLISSMLCSSKTCCLIEKWQSCNARRPNPNVSRGLESVGGNLVRWRIEKIFLLFIFPIKLVSSAYPKYHPNSVLYNTVGKTWTWKLFFLKAPQSFLIVGKKLTMKTNLSWREKSYLQI